MIEADIKGFLNDRAPNDPLFKPLNKQIDEGLGVIEYEKRRRLYKDANEKVTALAAVTSESSDFFTRVQNRFIPANMFLSAHYSYGMGWGHTKAFNFKMSDDMFTFAYLYSDAGSESYKSWKLAGAYNPVFLAAGKRTAMTFAGLPSTNDDWAAMDMSADGNIICLSRNLENERLVVLKRNDGSDNAYTAVTVDKQPAADATSMRMSGDGAKIFITIASAPYLFVFEANKTKTSYKQVALSGTGIDMTRAAVHVVPNFDGSTFALGYSTNTAALPAVDIYKILSGGVYTKVGLDYVAFSNLTLLFFANREGLQISRDGNTVLMYFLSTLSGASNNNFYNNYVPIVLKFNEDTKKFSLNFTEHNNFLWRINHVHPLYGCWPASGLSSGVGTIYRPSLSADGNWLFCASLTRRTSSPIGVYTQLSVMDISGGQLRKAVTIHSSSLITSSVGTSAVGGTYWMPHIFWVDPKMRYAFIGVIPNTNYQNTNPYYAYYLHTTYDKAYEIIRLDDNWLS